MLRFIGRDSAFHSHNNCAFFANGSELVLLDCPISAFHRLRHIGSDTLTGQSTTGIKVLVTHTHSDHAGGLGMLIHYCFFVLHIPVCVIAPSKEVAQDIEFLVSRLDGCSKDGYEINTADEVSFDWLTAAVKTSHAQQLEGRCFGWVLEIGGKRVIYTGDTNTLEPFEKYFTQGAYLYTEASAYDSTVHLSLDRLCKWTDTFKTLDMNVYLMHLDDEQAISAFAEKNGLQLAQLY